MSTLIERIHSSNIVRLSALSIRQPWASAIIVGGKDVENRSWTTKNRGYVYIHASKKKPSKEEENNFECFFAGEVHPTKKYEGKAKEFWAKMEAQPHGGIIGIAKITDCVTKSESPWFTGPYGFVLEDVHLLPFIACKGALGFFRPDFAAGQEDTLYKAMSEIKEEK